MRIPTRGGRHGTSRDKDVYRKLTSAADSRETLASVVDSTLGLTIAFVITFFAICITWRYFSGPIRRFSRRCRGRWAAWRRAHQVRSPAPPQEPQEPQGPQGPQGPPPPPDPEPRGQGIELQDLNRAVERPEASRDAAAADEPRASAAPEPPPPAYSPRPVRERRLDAQPRQRSNSTWGAGRSRLGPGSWEGHL